MDDDSAHPPGAAHAAAVSSPEISVIVPTHDRPAPLLNCLRALERQATASSIEVLVVDDGSTNDQHVARIVGQHPVARLIRQAQHGPAAARNAGVRAARGRFICFTDDDCQPAADWVERLTASLYADADATAGATINGLPYDARAEASQTIVEFLSTVDASGQLRFAPTSNLACKREVADAVPFDERYPAAAGEDRDWCARVRAAGYRLKAEPDAVVEHCPDLTLRRFWRQHVAYGRGACTFRRAHGERPLERPAFYAKLLKVGFRKGWATGLLVCLAQIATAAGYGLELAKLADRPGSGRR